MYNPGISPVLTSNPVPVLQEPSAQQIPQTNLQLFDTISSATVEPGFDLRVSKTASVSVSQLELKDCNIPCFDIHAINSSNGQARTRLIDDFCQSLRHVGFVAFKAENLVPLIDKVNQQMEAYFGQNLEAKMRDWKSSEYGGYAPKGTEKPLGAKAPDLKEFYQFSSKHEKWPENLPEFKDIMAQYYSELANYMKCAIQLLMEHFDEKAEDIDNTLNFVRLIKYLVPTLSDDPQAVWGYRHNDQNLLTLLTPTTVPGLQLLSKSNEWIDVFVPKGYLILNTGEQLEMKTAGYFIPTEHQILNPGGNWKYSPRYTALFAGSWPPEFSLKPFDRCIEKMCVGMEKKEKENYLQHYPDITVQEKLNARLLELGMS